MSFDVAIGFRDRGNDPRRSKNLACVVSHWRECGIEPIVVDDGRSGNAQWNRHEAYNRAAEISDADVLFYSEADIIMPIEQVIEGVSLAAEGPGLVVPFSWFMAMTEHDSERVRRGELDPESADAEPMCGYRISTGAVNAVSRETLEMVGGYAAEFEGAWFDDTAMAVIFEKLCGPIRFVDGNAYHLYHLPGASGDHLTDGDRAATAANERRYHWYLNATAEEIRNR